MRQKQKNRLFSVLILCLLMGCSEKPAKKNHPVTSPNIKQVVVEEKEFDSLAKTLEPKNLKFLILKTDSILLEPRNTKVGYYFHLRGICYTALEKHHEALSNLRKAQALGYEPENTQKLIDLNEFILSSEKTLR